MKTDVLIIGGGSSGFGAAYSAGGFDGIDVTLVERNSALGGTSTLAGVNCWEPGVGGNGVHAEIAEELLNSGSGGVGKYIGNVSAERPYSLSVTNPDTPYEETLYRAVPDISTIRRLHFEPEAMENIMFRKLRERNVNVMLNTEFTGVEASNGIITAVMTDREIIYPKVVIDCTGDIEAARAAGCDYMLGEDSADDFNEYCAAKSCSGILNGATLVFRVSPVNERYIDEIPAEYASIDVSEWFETKVKAHRLYSQCNEYMNGDLNVNMLPTMEGAEFHELGANAALPIMKARIYRYLNWLQSEKNFKYRMKYIFSMPGVRESYRLKGEYVLTENQIRIGYPEQERSDEVIAFGDHDLDTHGASNTNSLSPRLNRPYGIPYSCMLTNEVENMLVACRGASFSHITLSSCRLSRTMLALGEAAGAAAAISVNKNTQPCNINIAELRRILRIE